jgi:hypothetical protein
MKPLIPVLLGLGAVCAGLTVPAPAAASTAVNQLTVGASVNGTSTSISTQAGVAAGASRPACKGAGCEGLDPYASGCANDATSTLADQAVDYDNEIVAVVELRSSAACNASWAEVVALQPNPAWVPAPLANAFAPGLILDHSYTGNAVNAGNSWTAMVGSGFQAQACVVRPGTPAFNCTAVF